MPCSRSPWGVLSQHALQVSRPTPKGKFRGIWSRPTPKGEVEGDLARGWGYLLLAGCLLPGGSHDGYCYLQYASYWNAFLFYNVCCF